MKNPIRAEVLAKMIKEVTELRQEMVDDAETRMDETDPDDHTDQEYQAIVYSQQAADAYEEILNMLIQAQEQK